MAFLFKSKKNADKTQAAKEGGIAGSVSSLQSSNGRIAQNEKGAVQQTTPGSSVNNSLNSLQGLTATPSPEQINGRRGPSSEQAPDTNVSALLRYSGDRGNAQ
jgi:hypothetical protein